jgi:hypothetical protein
MKLFAPLSFNAVSSRTPARTPRERGRGREMQLFLSTVMLFGLAIFSAAAGTNAIAPVTPRDFYNAGTELLAAKKFAGAEQMFESALAAQDARVQPPALYNLGHARFADGAERLKQGPDAQKTTAQGNAALAAGGNAIRSMESALAENNLQKMIAAYVEGRGARRQLREAEKAVQAALKIFGYTLRQWQGAADDFKSTAELNAADTNASHNAAIVERDIARLVDSLQAMQQMAGPMGDQEQQLDQLLGKLKGKIPASDAPPGDKGFDDDENLQPESLAGRKENAPHEGGEIRIPISPDQAGKILDGISLDGARRLPMNLSDQQGPPPGPKNGQTW